MKNFLLLISLSLIFKIGFACQCPLTALNTAETNKYDIIFKGKINKVKIDGVKSIAIFTIEELYKGVITQNFEVYFNNDDVCKFDMRMGDEWIIYTNYYQINNSKLDFCSRSRNFIKNSKEDFFTETTGTSYEEELRYLQTKLGLHKIATNNSNKVENRNIIPNTGQFIITLLFSLAGIVFFIWLAGKFLKK